MSFTTEASCTAPTGLHIVEGSLTAHRVTMEWDIEEDVYYQYAMTHGITSDPTNVIWGYEEHILSLPYWTNLYADHDYTFYVRKWCSEEEQSEAIFISFHTPEACPAPTDFAVVDNSITGHEATLTWEGTSQSYNVSYRTAAYIDGIEESFDSNSLPSGWENKTGLLSTILDGGEFGTSTQWSFGTSNGVFDSHARINIYGTSRYGWLITPEFTLPTGAVLSFDLALTAYSGTGAASGTCDDDKFVVLVYADNAWQILRDWDNSGSSDVYNDIPTAGQNVSINLSGYTGKNVKIAFYGESTASNGDNNLHIDNVAIGTPVAAGEMQYVNNIEEQTVTLSDLLAERKYEAWLIGDCGSEGSSTEVGPITFTTDIACPTPTGLAVSELSATRVVISWDAEEGDMFQALMPGGQPTYPFNPNNPPTNWNTQEQTQNFAVWDRLIPETTYGIWLRKYCNDVDQSEPIYIMFTTLPECPVPTEVTVSDVGHYTATVNWTGNSEEGFKVMYRTATAWNLDGINEGFEDGTMPIGWTQSGPGTWNVTEGYGHNSIGAHEGTYNVTINHNDREDETFLITPMLDLSGQNGATMNFWYINFNWGSSDIDQIYVYYRINGGEWNELWNTTEDHQEWTASGDITLPNPSANYQIGFKMIDKYGHGVGLDDIVIGNPTMNPASEWQFITAANSPAGIGGLSFGTKYDVVVVPICDETAESEIVSFTTKSADEKIFAGTTSDDWNEGSNWIPYGVPTFDQTVELRANVTISDEAFANTISQGSYTITIEDGKLKSNTGVTATVKKSIRGYDTNYDPETYNNGDYYLITNPLTITVTPSEDNGFHVGNYDLYNWNYAEDLEWRNNVTSLYPGMYGYLYANETGTTLTYTGSINPYTGYKYRSASVPSSPENYDFPGWYLFGNPYMYDAYLTNASSNGTALPYIKMNANGDGFENVAAGTPIEPMEGFFYQGVSGATSAYVVTYEPTVQSNGKLNINLRSANKQLDNAILMFGGNQQMGKMTFRENSSKVYMPVEGKDYAITTAEGQMGEMPVNFKAEKNGSYTLSFTNEDVDFSYLHLIDNLTGEDVNLLAGASTGSAAYTFNASTTDYESRFKLVFATGTSAEGDSFSFVNASGNLCIFGIEGEATVQVIDILGHVISSETFSGSYERKINGAPGVYMVRLINGNDVKV